MPTLFWTGKISLPLRLMINMGSIIAWITGNARDSSAMKERMKDGYNGKYSTYIHKYDELASFHYENISNTLIQNIDLVGKEVVDIGCGTGILSLIALEKGAAKMSCVDISPLMLEKCREKVASEGYGEDLVSFHEGDAERLPFDDDTYDVVLSSMVLGMVPNQQSTITELTRILRPGGTIALSAHGPTHYMEVTEASVKSMNMRYYLGHRMEFWPRDEDEIRDFFVNAGLDNIQTERATWSDAFEDGRKAFDFFAATTGLWDLHRLPPDIRSREAEKARSYFQRKNVTKISSDVIFAFGAKDRDT